MLHPLQAALEALALEVNLDKVASCLNLSKGDGQILCPLCLQNLTGCEVPCFIITGKTFGCSNPKCSARGNVVDLVSFATGLPRQAAVGIVMKIKADQPLDLLDLPNETSRNTSSSELEIEADERGADRATRDDPQGGRNEDLLKDENIYAVIWNAQAKNAIVAPDDIFQVYVHQVGIKPLLDKGEEFLLAREIRKHREAYIDSMFKVDPILLEVALGLEDVLDKRCTPSRVLAPTPSLNGEPSAMKRPIRPTLNAIRQYLCDEAHLSEFRRRAPFYCDEVTTRLAAARKKCVDFIIALELRKSLLWRLYERALVLLESGFGNGGKVDLTAAEDFEPASSGPTYDGISANDLLKELRYHFSEHVRCMQDLASHSLRLAIQNAVKYRRSGLPVEDLVQAANLGLLAACERFDERRGARFATYATWWIRQSLQREIDNCSTLIRLPPQMRRMWEKLQEFLSTAYQQTGNYPPIEDVLQETDLPQDVAYKLVRVGMGVVFLSELEKNEYKAYRDCTLDKCTTPPFREAVYSELKRGISDTIKQKLTSRMQLVLSLRFGLNNQREHTLEEIAEELKVTRERVRQIQKRALERLDITEVRHLAGLPPKVKKPEESEKPTKKRRKYAKRKTKQRKKL